MLAVALGASVFAAGYALWPREVPLRLLVVSTPPVVIERVTPAPALAPIPPPAPPPPPVPPPPAPKLAAPVSSRCAAHLETVGVPLADGMLDGSYDDPGPDQTYTIDPAGCAFAIKGVHELQISWDGGQTFARYAFEGHIEQLALAGDRAVMLHDGKELGVVHAGDDAIAWRPLGTLAAGVGGRTMGDSWLSLAAAGPWTAVMRNYSSPPPVAPPTDPAAPAAPADPAAPAPPKQPARLLALSDDDGATWRYMTPPEAETLQLTADGRVWLTRQEWLEPESPRTKLRSAASDLAHTRWLSGAQLPIVRGTSDHLAFVLDRFWGCGGTEKLVRFRGDRIVDELASNLNTNVADIALAQNAVAAYTIHGEHLYRVRGGRTTDLGDVVAPHLIGVDRDGSLLAQHGPVLMRWSEHGGWRVLWQPAKAPSTEP
ncbi:MAG TPA: hypothetical protein VGC42_28990 [Kofleriaceae bacterium]